MMGKLSGKVAIVTGASSGMGAATAVDFAREGAKVVLAARNEEKLKSVLASVEDVGGEGVIVVADVSKDEDNKRIVDTAMEKFGGLHVSFINAGIGDMKSILELEDDVIDKVMGTNFKGVIFGLKHQMPAMSKSGNTGSIVVNSSPVGEHVMVQNPAAALYASSKAAANMMIKYGAVQGAAMNIRVNGIAPGVTMTSMAGDGEEAEKTIAKIASGVHLLDDKPIWPGQVAKLVTFLSSDDASVMTGSLHHADKGCSLKM